jgi:hypothetical protein
MLRLLAIALLLPALGAAQAASPHSRARPSKPAPTAPGAASGQTISPATSCGLPASLWQHRQALKKQFDASGGQSDGALQGIQAVDAQYRRFLVAVTDAYATGQFAAIDACCLGTKGDPEATIVCGLLRYLQGGRKQPERFLAALPETPDAAAALDDLEQAASPDQHASSLATLPVYSVTEELYRLMVGGNPRATARYFWLLHHSSGAWADDAADQLERFLRNHPEAVIRDWPFLKNFWNLSDGITWDVDANWWQGTIENFRRACRNNDRRCREILALLQKAAHAAGAP